MKLHRCQCDADLYVRIPRSLWMRLLFPSRCLYYCWHCRRKMLVAHLDRAGDTTSQQRFVAS